MNPSGLLGRGLEYLADNAGACVAIAVATIGAAGAAVGSLVAHESRHVALEAFAAQARDDRQAIYSALSKLEARQERTLDVLLELKRASE